MITAQAARELAGPTVEERVAAVGELIEAAAKDKKRVLHLHDNFWVQGGYSGSEDWKAAKKLLEEAGYKVSFYYREMQFVDMYTMVEW